MTGTVIPLDRVLALRPTNAVARLGTHSRLLVLNPRDLLSVLPHGLALACLPVYSDEAVPALLKASRDEDAAVGISLPWPLGERDAPARMVEALADEAESVRHRAPMFLQAGPFRITSTGLNDVERLTSAVFDYLEAGFTHFCIDASALEVAQAAAVAEIVQHVVERELSVELTPPLAEGGKWEPERAQTFLEALGKGGLSPTFLRLPATAYALTPEAREVYELDLSVLEAARTLAESHGAALSVAQDGQPPERVIRTLLAVGVRKVDVDDPFVRAVLGGWGPEASELLHREAASQRLEPKALLRRTAEALGVAVSDAARIRSESRHWAAAQDVLMAVGARGTGSLSVARLGNGASAGQR